MLNSFVTCCFSEYIFSRGWETSDLLSAVEVVMSAADGFLDTDITAVKNSSET